jgi:hypothetical protein
MSNNLYLNNKLLREVYNMLYLVSSILAAIVFTIFSMISYHMVLKSQISKDMTFEWSGAVIASDIKTYFEIFVMYFLTALIGSLASPFIAFVLLVIEFLLFSFVFYADTWYASNRRWLNK